MAVRPVSLLRTPPPSWLVLIRSAASRFRWRCLAPAQSQLDYFSFHLLCPACRYGNLPPCGMLEHFLPSILQHHCCGLVCNVYLGGVMASEREGSPCGCARPARRYSRGGFASTRSPTVANPRSCFFDGVGFAPPFWPELLTTPAPRHVSIHYQMLCVYQESTEPGGEMAARQRLRAW